MSEARAAGVKQNKNHRILVIDDNRAIHDDFRKILSPSQGISALAEVEAQLFNEPANGPAKVSQPTGFETESAYHSQEGVELLRKSREQGRPYSVAFVDMRMSPGWDGIETIKNLWEVDPDLQVVICTAYSDPSWDEIVTQLGNSDRLLLLKKPFDPVEILQLANALTDKWRLNRQVKRQMNDLERIVSERTRQLQRALDELRTAQGQIVQQERLHALGGMASGIAHDFNNALVGILGLSELLLLRPENLDDKVKARRYLEMINTTARDAGKIVNRLREFYRFRDEREALETTDLNHLIEEAISLTEPKWKTQTEANGVSIVVQKELQNVPTIESNTAELREMLTNLIFNSVDAMPKGGTITLRTYSIGDQVVLEVGDTGKGMPEEVRRRCFEPFFSTKGEHGSGLGLAMVYGVVQRHQGTIEIKSEVDKGTTFIIRIAAQSAPAKPEVPTPAAPKAAQNLRILLVDDEAMVRNVIGEYLKGDGHAVETAGAGTEGVEKFRRGAFDVVLVDRAMPDMNGDEVAAAIKSTNPSVPVIMLTGFGSMMQGNGEKPSGVDMVLGKPITMADMRAAIASAVGVQVA